MTKIIRKGFFLLGMTFLSTQVMSGVSPSLTPLPASLVEKNGEFRITPLTPIVIEAPRVDKERLTAYIRTNLPLLNPDAEMNDTVPSIKFVLSPSAGSEYIPESYSVVTSPEGITVTGADGAGLFYGLQTLIQLADGRDIIPSVEINDYPRLEYRGMMLDISRHFRDKEFIKKQIDALASLKGNTLHLHLTDAAGWRIQIDSFPRLTDYAAWRPHLTWKEWRDDGSNYTDVTDPWGYGGFLSKDDAREIVEYAAERYITVIPEIEMPSHSEEVTSAYPEISCTGTRQPDVCVGNEKTFEFFQGVLDEIMEIFPSKYIHIGGDEASKRQWQECELCRLRMQTEGLENVDQLQSYMIERIESYLNSKGREIIGWDEIMEGGLAPNATVMSWRGTEGGIKAALSGHNAIMTPGAYCYLDGYQDAPVTQLQASGAYTPLKKVYGYDPVPDSLSEEVKRRITGVQGNLWTEHIPTAQHAEYMLYPRMIAISEIGWTPQELREWDDFYPRALRMNDRLQERGYHVFDLRGETGSRREAQLGVEHLGKGKKVIYNRPWWRNYNANFEKTLTDGEKGDWTYGDGKWQGFVGRSPMLDVTVDLETEQEIGYVGAEFMQITEPGVWFPESVVISVSDDGENFRELTTVEHEQKETSGLSFKTYAWNGDAKARYVRYQASASRGCLFTDEIVIR